MDEIEALKVEAGNYVRLTAFLARVVEEGNCWKWTGSVQNGVPMMPMGKRQKYIAARRYIMEVKGIQPKQGMAFLGTTCGNPECVKPEHIKQRTVREQMKRMAKESIKVANNPVRRQKIAVARRLASSRLTPEQVLEIASSEESGPVLSERYGICKSSVNRIKRGDAWQSVVHQDNPFAGLLSGLVGR